MPALHSAHIFHLARDEIDPDGELRKAGWWVFAHCPSGQTYLGGPYRSEDEAIDSWIMFVEGGLSESPEQVTRH